MLKIVYVRRYVTLKIYSEKELSRLFILVQFNLLHFFQFILLIWNLWKNHIHAKLWELNIFRILAFWQKLIINMKRTRSLYSNHADVVAYNFRHNALNVFCNFLVEIDDLVVYRKFTSFDFFCLLFLLQMPLIFSILQ